MHHVFVTISNVIALYSNLVSVMDSLTNTRNCHCEICNLSPCLWIQFSGYELAERLMDTSELGKKQYVTKKGFITGYNNCIKSTKTRMIELWKEFYGIRQGYSEMKTREDFLVFTDTLMSQTPSCIEINLTNYLPFLKVDPNSKQLCLLKLRVISDPEYLFAFDDILMPAKDLFPNTGKLQRN